MIDLSIDQKNALNFIFRWLQTKNSKQYITLGGYAGTGKTTLISLLRERLKDQEQIKKINKNFKKSKNLKVAFCSYTGKASQVLNTKLKELKSIEKGDSVSTIHSLIYSPIINQNKEIIGWEKKDSISVDLIIIDEASMVSADIWNDLLFFKKPIIAVGDHGQLPPINSSFNLMENPDIKLEKIHRQAKNNPIISLSIQARTKGVIQVGKYGQGVEKILRDSQEAQEIIGEELKQYSDDYLLLCGYNATRVRLNKHIRSVLGFFSPIPEPGDRVICLRNNHEKQIFNGMLGTLLKIEENEDEWYYAEIEMDGSEKLFQGLIAIKQFNNKKTLSQTSKRKRFLKGDLFDFGYALTVHKAQGSQAKKVILFEERFSKMDEKNWRRWLYTGITRAEKELLIVGA